jgi:glycosyltransferase involved in cell wall biosynthesis
VSHQSSGLILNDLGPSLLDAAGIPGVSLLTGSDLTYYANCDSDEIRSAMWDAAFAASAGGRLARRKWREFVARQRSGILGSRAVSFGVPGLVQEADALLREIGVPDERRFSVYLADTVDLAPAPPRLRKQLRVFNGARLNWRDPFPAGFSAQDNKRTDILLEGFGEFLRAGGEGTLVLVEKGLHVAETKELANSLGITRNVEWLREMTLAEFYVQVRDADVICDQMGPSFPGMAGLDAMAIGRPVIANFRLDLLGPYYQAPWPVLHVESVQRVRDALLDLYRFPETRASLGTEARAFAERHLSPEANAVRCLEQLGVGIAAPAVPV